MEISVQAELLQSFSDALEPPFSGSVYEWASINVSLPTSYAVQGSFDISISPYLIKPFHDLKDTYVSQVNLVGATQTGKTLVSEIFIPYVIANSPGPVLKLHQSDEMSQTFVETRLIPLLKNCKVVAPLLEQERYAAKKTGIILPHMSIKVSGQKENILHGLTVKYLLLDEVWLYEKDAVTKAKARTTAFGNQKKILITSQPGIEGDQLSQEDTGLSYEWGWRCKECNNLQPWYWSKEKENGSWAGIVWDKTYKEATRFEYDYEATGQSARLQCFHCSASYKDTDENRRHLNDSGDYILTKDNGNHAVHTYSWCAFVNPKISFKEKTIQYLQATSQHKKTGLTDGLKIFRQQVLGQAWKRTAGIDVSKVLVQTFNPDETWKEQVFKCLSVDYQRKHEMKFWSVIAFSPTEIRIVDHGYCAKWDDIDAIAKKHRISPPAVCVDSGYNASEVYLEAYNHGAMVVIGKKIDRWGWTCLKGDDADEGYPHKLPDGTKIMKYFSPMTKVAINNTQWVRLYHWGNFPIKTTLHHIREGKSDMTLVLPTADADFNEQINAESLVEVQDNKTGLRKLQWQKRHDNNHYLDCLCQAIVMCQMSGKFGPDPIRLATKPVSTKPIETKC